MTVARKFAPSPMLYSSLTQLCALANCNHVQWPYAYSSIIVVKNYNHDGLGVAINWVSMPWEMVVIWNKQSEIAFVYQ